MLDIPADFDLPVAIALAAAAFEAYLEPVGANERFQEVTVNNTHVTYTDRCGANRPGCLVAVTTALQVQLQFARPCKEMHHTQHSFWQHLRHGIACNTSFILHAAKVLLAICCNLHMPGVWVSEFPLPSYAAYRVHRKFLQQQFEGILQLTIHGAKDLKAVNVSVCSAPCSCCALPYCSRAL